MAPPHIEAANNESPEYIMPHQSTGKPHFLTWSSAWSVGRGGMGAVDIGTSTGYPTGIVKPARPYAGEMSWQTGALTTIINQKC